MIGASSSSVPPSPDGRPLRDRVLAALIDEGHRPRIDDDGDVALAVEAQMLFVRCPDDVRPRMVRVFGQWQLDDSIAGDELTRLRAASAVTGALNLVKVSVKTDLLAVAVDLIVDDGTDLGPLLTAVLEMMLDSVRAWHQTVTGLLEEANPAEGS